MSTFTPEKASADIGVYGLGVMGANLARNLARNGYATAVSTGPRLAPTSSWPSTATKPPSSPRPRLRTSSPPCAPRASPS